MVTSCDHVTPVNDAKFMWVPRFNAKILVSLTPKLGLVVFVQVVASVLPAMGILIIPLCKSLETQNFTLSSA